MPIYEFKCVQCDQFHEFLFKSSDEKFEMKCKNCGSRSLERVLSSTSHVVSGGGEGGSSQDAGVTSRSCGSGSCTTWNLPGPNG